ncbi:Opy1p [Lachancea thermotolerans CBS 6340]|uniref:KLTH0F11418p n=1 Tax=Lachancea thermotolerans (strain ATCC 56472 / CBS 6340 / NRRL Y-8284) TaxID=559295 RepID=C5DLA6_LACTC|nr:KLTH0F11418p [Lachancea thermotolerans CBS 6340]CAR24257.1 KLTH0F11418p [Lachancea thermotolerans CBS 6340]
MDQNEDLKLLYTDTQHFNDVLISSFLFKKSSSSAATNKLASDHKQSAPGTSSPDIGGSHHWFMRGGFHKYWCVLRRGQFSYYKDKNERKPVDVIPADQVLDFRVRMDEYRLDFYTKQKTISFGSESQEVLRGWDAALQEFVSDRRRSSLPMRIYDSGNDENDNECICEDDDDDFEILSEAQPQDPEKERDRNVWSSFKVPDEDREFYAIYNPEQPKRVIQTGTLLCRVKKRLGRKTWKRVNAVLENTSLLIESVSSGRLYKKIDLNGVVDCVEDEKSRYDTGFAVITYDERTKFRAPSEQDTIEWIMNLKSCVLVRKKLEELKSLCEA